MFYGDIRTKQDLSYVLICLFSILYNSKFIVMATSLGTNAVVHCIRAVSSERLSSYTPKSFIRHLLSFIHSEVANDSVTESNGPDQTTRMHRLILGFYVSIYLKTHILKGKRNAG